MNINIKSVNKLEEKYRVIHPEHGTLVAVMGSEQLRDLLILITGKQDQAFILRGVNIAPRYEGYVDTQVYLIKEEHFDTINDLVGFDFEDGYEMVSRQTCERAQTDDELLTSWSMIKGCIFYFVKRKPEPFEWIKNESPLDTIRVKNEMVLIYSEAYHSKVAEMSARAANRNGLPWADIKHKDRFTADNPAPSPYNQE